MDEIPATSEESRLREGLCLGLIGGLAVGATIHYYRELALAHEQIGKPMRLMIAHADMPRVAKHVWAGEHTALAEYFAALIENLRAAGADIAAIPAVTPHCCLQELLPISPLPLIDALSPTDDEVRQRGYRRVALFGTRFVIESGLFGHLSNAELVRPHPEEVEFIHNTYFRLAETGVGTDLQRLKLTEIAFAMIDREQVDAIVLAGTDFAVLFDGSNTEFPHVDSSRAHIDRIMSRLHAL